MSRQVAPKHRQYQHTAGQHLLVSLGPVNELVEIGRLHDDRSDVTRLRRLLHRRPGAYRLSWRSRTLADLSCAGPGHNELRRCDPDIGADAARSDNWDLTQRRGYRDHTAAGRALATKDPPRFDQRPVRRTAGARGRADYTKLIDGVLDTASLEPPGRAQAIDGYGAHQQSRRSLPHCHGRRRRQVVILAAGLDARAYRRRGTVELRDRPMSYRSTSRQPPP